VESTTRFGAESGEVLGVTDAASAVEVDVLFVPVFGSDDALTDLPWLNEATHGEVSRAREAGEFESKVYDCFAAPVAGSTVKARRIGLIGAGAAVDLTAERWRRIGSVAGYAARRFGAPSSATLVRGVAATDAGVAAGHVADGLLAADFIDASYRTSRRPAPPPRRRLVLVPGGHPGTVAAAVARGRVVGECANFARSLANEPANVLTPAEFADRVSRAARGVGLGVEVLDEVRMRELGMGLLLSVAQGSVQPPRLVVLRHDPPGAPENPLLALVGKGVTFDTGGVSIKPADGMDRMKDDMAGGAAVAAAMLGLASLKTPRRTIGIIPLTENMVSGRATRPGDVVQGASGLTVEVNNTDAEGRLILGDAHWFAREQGATHLVDVATLTGAIGIALGRHVAGLFGAPDAWVETVRDAGRRGGDRLWPLPIYDEAREQLRSEIADMLNSAGRPGGAVTAAAFLREFTGGLPWAHLDIAGTAWAESREPYQPKGATSMAVRTLIELASSVTA
jgi:leucyl aminopeptidase